MRLNASRPDKTSNMSIRNRSQPTNANNNEDYMVNHIIRTLIKVKSVWQLLNTITIQFENINWKMILENLPPLFRKNSFCELVSKEKYYPQATPNCRYYIKPVHGTCGHGIRVVNHFPENILDDHIVCPEIIPSLIEKDGKLYKYDYRVWVGIKADLTYYVCPTFIKRISNVPFSLDTDYGSLTNTALYSDQFDYEDEELYKKINKIVRHVLSKLTPNNENDIMLTGWDFIENQNNEVFVLEVNPNLSLNIQHEPVMREFLKWTSSI